MSSAQNPPGPLDPTASAAAPKPTLLEGTPYRFIAPLGRGGMGDVVEAEHIALGKRVVVKLLQERHAGRADYVDRMRIEAQALAKISHPNLVQVTDFGQTAEGRTFLVMELLRGKTVRDELEARKFVPVLDAMDMLRQTLAGLAAAHEAGIVHRDVKLDNLFLCDAPDGGRRTLKVLDFGVAKVIGVMGDNTPLPLAFPTAEGVAMGTPRFFSPEQARGRQVDQRTDIYAAGMVLYHLIAGRGPFDRHTTLLDLSRAHAFEAPEPPSRLAPQPIPPALDAAVLKALAKDPNDRFRSALEFAAELERIAAEMSAAEARIASLRAKTTSEAPKMPVVEDDEIATMRFDALLKGNAATDAPARPALPKGTDDDDDAPPETPTQRLERPMAFMRSGPFAAQVAARQAAEAAALQTTLPSPAAPAAPAARAPSEPPQTQASPTQGALSLPEPPTLPKPDVGKPETKDVKAAPEPVATRTASSPPHPSSKDGATSRDPHGVPQRESAIPRLFGAHSPLREPAIPRLFGQSGERISSLPRAPATEAIPPPAPLPDTTMPSATTKSDRPEASTNPATDLDMIPTVTARAPEPAPTPHARADRISVLPGRNPDRISALPGRSPDRTSALPGRSPDRTPAVPPHNPEAGFPERKSGIPAAPTGRSGPPAPLPEERGSAAPQGGARPLRAPPVPWRMKRPASSSGAQRSNPHGSSMTPPPSEGDSQMKLLFFFAAFALLTAGVLVALRFLR